MNNELHIRKIIKLYDIRLHIRLENRNENIYNNILVTFGIASNNLRDLFNPSRHCDVNNNFPNKI